jgi:hypothetical protein
VQLAVPPQILFVHTPLQHSIALPHEVPLWLGGVLMALVATLANAISSPFMA